MPKTSTAPNRRKLGERGVAQALLGDFDPEKSKGMKVVMKFFDNKISVNRLISLGTILSQMLNLEFPRNYKRNRDLLVKWFDMNLEIIEPNLDKITIVFDENDEKKNSQETDQEESS